MVAANLLIKSDTPALRHVAGLDKSDAWLIERAWPEAMTGLGVGVLEPRTARKLAGTHLVEALRSGDQSAEAVLRAAARVFVENGYPTWAREASYIYGLEDELDGGWGRTREVLLEEATEILGELAAD